MKSILKNGRSGGYVTLVAVLIVAAVGLSAATSMLLTGIGSARTSLVLENSYKAKALADACAEDSLRLIRQSASYSGNISLYLGDGSCSSTVIKHTGQARTLISSGSVGSILRKVKVIINKITPHVAIASWQEVADF
jgi:hypothetical protein